MGPFGHLTTKDAETLAFIRTISGLEGPVNWSRWSFCDTRVRSLMLLCVSSRWRDLTVLQPCTDD